jgi:hypothetical protein
LIQRKRLQHCLAVMRQDLLGERDVEFYDKITALLMMLRN